MNPLVELAIQDLAIRLNLDPGLITIIDVQSVTWPDSSLGCSQEGMMYAQVEMDGYLIRLAANSQIYEYHTDKRQNVTFCENTQYPA